MTGRARWGRRAMIAATVAILAVAAYLLLWSTLMVYDDEGYILYSLQAFTRHGHLYDVVYSQYGPFFFLLYRALHVLGFEFTHTMARCSVLGCWTGTAAICGALVWRETRGSWVATVVTLVAVFLYLWQMVSEPGHPGGLIALLTAVAAWCGTHPGWSSRRRSVAIGTIGAALALTKINVGVFLLASAGIWWALHLPAVQRRRWSRCVVAAAIAALPFLLMRPFLGTAWIATYAVVVATSAVSVVFAAGTGEFTATGGELVNGAAAAAIVGASLVALTVATGTSLRELLHGVVLDPLNQPLAYFNPVRWRPGALWVAAAAMPIAAWAATRPAERAERWITPARLLIAGAYAVPAMGVLTYAAAYDVLSYGIALAWVFVLPTGRSDRTQAVRGWLALLLVMQSLHAYPVAGSQTVWGTFLWIPLVVLGLYEVIVRLPAWVHTASAAAAGTLAALMLGRCVAIGGQRYAAEEDLQLPGAEHVRAGTWLASTLRILARNAELDGDMVFSIPGMLSFNLWTGLPPPTVANATQWFTLLSPARQQAILERLQASPRSVIILQRRVYDDLAARHLVPDTPLLRWVFAHYEPRFTLETYEFWVRKHREVAIIDAAHVYGGVAGAPTRFQVTVTTAATRPLQVSAIELRRLDGDTTAPVLGWTNANAEFVTTEETGTGKLAGTAVRRKLPFTIGGITQLTILTNDFPKRLAVGGAIIYLLDAHRQRIGEARFFQTQPSSK